MAQPIRAGLSYLAANERMPYKKENALHHLALKRFVLYECMFILRVHNVDSQALFCRPLPLREVAQPIRAGLSYLTANEREPFYKEDALLQLALKRVVRPGSTQCGQ